MLPGLPQDEENDKTGRDDGDHQDSDNTGLSLKLDYQLGEFTLSSITAYNWTFGDQSAAVTTENATHTYAVAGTYSVVLTVTTF
jgi:hypothetical protein